MTSFQLSVEFFSLPPGIGMIMTESIGAVRRRQYCVLCGQQMFEFYRSPDGHFGFVDEVMAETSARGLQVRCANMRDSIPTPRTSGRSRASR